MKMFSVRVVLDLAASLNLEIKQLDKKTTFLHNSDLDKEICMKQLKSMLHRPDNKFLTMHMIIV